MAKSKSGSLDKPQKLAFPFLEQVDEWNPHIVRYFRDEVPQSKKDLLSEKDDLEKRNANIKIWLDKWNSAQEILNKAKRKGIYPLAYRLEPKLSEIKRVDPVEGLKFGGIPDFRSDFSFKDGLSKGKTPKELIANFWPRCGGCMEYMRFLGGVDLTDWLIPIHMMTANNPTKTSYRSNIPEDEIPYYQHSGLGYGRDLGDIGFGFGLTRNFWNIFYCDSPHFESPAYDSRIIVESRFRDENKEVMDIKRYKKEIREFVKKHKIKSNIPIQKLEGLTLKFDIDVPGKEFPDAWMCEAAEEYPEIFGRDRDSDYQFFGKPRSQQTEKRYACQNSFLGLHRMAPIVNWTDCDHDFTYQIYGCLKCRGQESHDIYCKTDGSCT